VALERGPERGLVDAAAGLAPDAGDAQGVAVAPRLDAADELVAEVERPDVPAPAPVGRRLVDLPAVDATLGA
jgi:hypothetical protein